MNELKFMVDMAELRSKVNFVRNGLGNTRTDLPTMLVRCNLNGNKLTLFAANKSMFCRTELKTSRPDDSEDGGTFALLGHKLTDLINTAQSEQVAFKVDGDSATITAGFLNVVLTLYDPAGLKQTETATEDHLTQEGILIDRGHLEEALTCAKACTTTNSIRPDVTHVELRNGRMLASDSRKIMIYSHDGFDEKAKLKVPAEILNPVLSATKNITAPKVQIIEGPSYFYVKANLNEHSFGLRKTERDFPPVEGQIQRSEKPTDELSIDKQVLIGILEGVALGLDNDEVKVLFEAAGELKEAYLEVSARNSLGKRSFERTFIGRAGTGTTTFPISFKHLLDTLAVFKGDGIVDIQVMAPMNFAIVRDATEVREVTTVIPFRTDAQVEKENQEKAALEAARKKEAAAPANANADQPSETATEAAEPALEGDIDLA
jgi:hypothetical protein